MRIKLYKWKPFFNWIPKEDHDGSVCVCVCVNAIRNWSLCSHRSKSHTGHLRSGANTEGPKGITGASRWHTPLINVQVLDIVILNWEKKQNVLGSVQRGRFVYVLHFRTPPNSLWHSFSSHSFVLVEASVLMVETKIQVDWSARGVLIKLILCLDPWPSNWQQAL